MKWVCRCFFKFPHLNFLSFSLSLVLSLLSSVSFLSISVSLLSFCFCLSDKGLWLVGEREERRNCLFSNIKSCHTAVSMSLRLCVSLRSLYVSLCFCLSLSLATLFLTLSHCLSLTNPTVIPHASLDQMGPVCPFLGKQELTSPRGSP